MLIDGLEYHISEKDFEYHTRYGSKYAYFNPNAIENWYNKNMIRVYNHYTKEHLFLERVWANIGDNNLLFIDFPRMDGPIDSWCKAVTQYAIIKSWSDRAENELGGDFVRFTIDSIDKDNFCKVSDGYNSNSGWYARGAFYKIIKTCKM